MLKDLRVLCWAAGLVFVSSTNCTAQDVNLFRSFDYKTKTLGAGQGYNPETPTDTALGYPFGHNPKFVKSTEAVKLAGDPHRLGLPPTSRYAVATTLDYSKIAIATSLDVAGNAYGDFATSSFDVDAALSRYRSTKE